MHPPTVIFVMLFGVALMNSVPAGYATVEVKNRHWIHIFGFAAIIGITVYVILDIEYPRVGLIRLDKVDQVLLDIRKDMD